MSALLPLLAHEIAPAGAARDEAARIAAAVPVLSSARLTLRAPRIEDFPLYAEIVTGARAEGIGGPLSREEAWDDWMRLVGLWLMRGHGLWVMETSEAEVAGFVLLGFEPGDQEPELGWFATEAHEGQGLVTEAALAVLAHARDTLRLPSLVSYIDPQNARSAAVARRLGARLDGQLDGAEIWRHLPRAGGAA